MINISRLLSNTPIPIKNNIKFYQPTVGEIIDMGETTYWSLLKIWCMKRKELIQEETEETKKLSDYEIWKAIVLNNEQINELAIQSIDLFLHTKIDFLKISNTIMIGEGESLFLLDEQIFNYLSEIAKSVFLAGENEEKEQYQENDKMSAKEKELIAKMKKRQEMLNKTKEENNKDHLANNIVSLVAIGHYTYEEVYKMTFIQFNTLLQKYVEIENYELTIPLSPYMDSKKNPMPKHWLN